MIKIDRDLAQNLLENTNECMEHHVNFRQYPNHEHLYQAYKKDYDALQSILNGGTEVTETTRMTIQEIYYKETGKKQCWDSIGKSTDDNPAVAVYVEGPTPHYIKWLEARAATALVTQTMVQS